MTSPPAGPSDSSRRSRTLLLLAGGFLVLVVICLFIVLFSTRGEQQPQTGTPQGGPAAAPTTPDNGDKRIPTAAPPGVTWTFFHGVALPQSRTYGPTQVRGDLAAGYAHSPTGALLAAANISVRYGSSPEWRAILDEQTVPGPGREAFAAIRAEHPISASSQPAPGSRGQIAGFRFVNYTPEVATIQIVSQFASYGGVLQMTTLTVRWNGQDWLLELQPDGGASPTASRVNSLAQFTPWGPS